MSTTETILTEAIARAAHARFGDAPAKLIPWEKLAPGMRDKFLYLFGAPMAAAILPTVQQLIEDARTADRAAITKVRAEAERLRNHGSPGLRGIAMNLDEALDGAQ